MAEILDNPAFDEDDMRCILFAACAFCALASGAFAAEAVTEVDVKPLTEGDLLSLDGPTVPVAPPQAGTASPWSVWAEVSTLGLGAAVDYRVTPEWGVRLVGNGVAYSRNEKLGSLTYNKDNTLASGGVIADYYPMGDGLRLSGGVRYNGNGSDISASPGGPVSLGGQSFQASEVGRLSGSISYAPVSPYLGIGYEGEIASGLVLVGEIGTMIQTGRKVKLDSSGGSLSGTPQMQQALDAERQSIGHDLDSTKFYPVASLAMKYSF
jgi:hypothetical protein